MSYELKFSPLAEQHLLFWSKSGAKKDLKKLLSLFEELKAHPTTDTGHIEQLKADLSGYWSRQINKKDRLIYTINDEIVTVTVISAKGHYGQK
jgi:toxin YoeB